MIAVEFARFLGLPLSRRSNVTDVLESVCGVCLDARTTLVCVDEIHNVNLGTRHGAEASDTLNKFDVVITVDGGGMHGQAGAVQHGIARALVEFSSELRGVLKKEGFLTRDPRMKERKKYGQPGARKRFQFSKR